MPRSEISADPLSQEIRRSDLDRAQIGRVEGGSTRSEVRAEFDLILGHYATKADIANLKVAKEGARHHGWMLTTIFMSSVTVGAAVVAVLKLWR